MALRARIGQRKRREKRRRGVVTNSVVRSGNWRASP